jgi:chromosome partitioning protein
LIFRAAFRILALAVRSEKDLSSDGTAFSGGRQRSFMGKIIAVANQKGGVGKTTTSINLSASLAAARRRVLLVDMDPQANATSGLGFFLSDGEPDLYRVLTRQVQAEAAIRATDLASLKLLPARPHLAALEVELVEHVEFGERALQLRETLDPLRESFDFIIIDCPPSLGLLTLNALTAADSVLIPVQTEYYAMEGLGRLMDTVGLVRQSANPNLEYEGVLLCMTDDRTNLSRQVSEEIRGHLESRVFETTIPRNIRLSESPSHGKPVLLYSVSSKGAQSYLQLAEELIRLNEPEPKKPRNNTP